MTFILVDATRREQQAAEAVMALYGIPFQCMDLRLPEEVDVRYPHVEQSAFLGAERAAYRNGGTTPLVVGREGLRIFALNDLPGTGYAFVLAMFGSRVVVDAVDRAEPADRRCVLEKAVHLYDPAKARTFGPDGNFLVDGRTTFTKSMYGTIATQEQLKLLGREPRHIHDIFVPERCNQPLSLLSEGGAHSFEDYFDEVYLDLVGHIEEAYPEWMTARQPQPADDEPVDVVIDEDLEDPLDAHDPSDTLVVPRDQLFTEEQRARMAQLEGPGVYRHSDPEMQPCDVIPSGRRRSSQTLIGIPAMPADHEDPAPRAHDSTEEALDEFFGTPHAE